MLGITKKTFSFTSGPTGIIDSLKGGWKYEFHFLETMKMGDKNWAILSKRIWKAPWKEWRGGGRW